MPAQEISSALTDTVNSQSKSLVPQQIYLSTQPGHKLLVSQQAYVHAYIPSKVLAQEEFLLLF